MSAMMKVNKYAHSRRNAHTAGEMPRDGVGCLLKEVMRDLCAHFFARSCVCVCVCVCVCLFVCLFVCE